MLENTTVVQRNQYTSDNFDDSSSLMIDISHKTVIPAKRHAKANSKAKRIRERRISEVVQAVAVWRRLYRGVKTSHGDADSLVRYSLTDAAHKVGISRKTLDDYLHLLAMGRKFGFPFTAR